MRKKFFIIVILCMTIILSSCSGAKSTITSNADDTTLTKDQWVDDIDYLEQNLSEKHYNVYHAIKKEDLEKQFSDLKKEVPRLKDYEIRLKMAKIVASIGDAHTSLTVDSQADGKVYPFGVWWLGKELKVFAIDKEYKEIIGYNLIAINNIPIEEVMAKINTLISHENEQWLKVINVTYVQMPEVLKFLNIIKEDEAEFTFNDDKGNIKKLNLSPKTSAELNTVYARDLMTKKPVITQQGNSNLYDTLYWYKYIPEDKIMYFKYNQCMDRNIAKMMGYKNWEQFPDFSEFGDDLIKEINDKDIDKFIIDLRDNTGGDSSLMSDFAGKLYDIKKLKEQGKVFVMTGRKTFSSGVLACLTIKNSTKALFFGEATGGNVNGYGEITAIILPNSKIQVSCSTKYFDKSSEYKEGFIPDVTIEQSFNNYISGIDDVYEAIRNYKN